MNVFVSRDISENETSIKSAFGYSTDLVVRIIRSGENSRFRVLIAHIDGLVDKDLVAKSIIRPIGMKDTATADMPPSPAYIHDDLRNRLLESSEVKEVTRMADLPLHISSGDCAVIVEGVDSALICSVRGWLTRTPENPTTEPAIRGPKEGFTETIRVNTSLLRRRIRDPRLWIEDTVVGEVSKTDIAIVYVKGVANEKVLQEVRDRIGRVKVDSLQESGQLEELIEDAPSSVFATVLTTERPDNVAGSLFEGRVAILVDGSPTALVVPATFLQFLMATEDYYQRFTASWFIRLIRTIAFLVALALPSVYVAITTYHQEMLPTPLVLSIAAQREGVPFPAAIEALTMILFLEVLLEGGVRLPTAVGSAISIVGALILGQAAVEAGLFSAAMVIIVALTAIASFTIPIFSLTNTVRILRIILTIISGFLGLFGVAAALFGLLIHLTAMRSFGIPYFEPLAPVVLPDLKDAITRAPWWAMKQRPELIAHDNVVRIGDDRKPTPPSPSEGTSPRSVEGQQPGSQQKQQKGNAPSPEDRQSTSGGKPSPQGSEDRQSTSGRKPSPPGSEEQQPDPDQEADPSTPDERRPRTRRKFPR